MRSTIDLPDALFRRSKALAAMRGSTLKDLIIVALEREVGQAASPRQKNGLKLPLLHLRHRRTFDLKNVDIDDLLA